MDRSRLLYRIVPIAEEHIEGFRAAVDSVAREHRYLAFLEAPPLSDVRGFVCGNIRSNLPQFVALVDDAVVGWCDVLPKPRPVFRYTGVLGMGVINDCRGRGIGTALMATTLQAAKQSGITRVELHVREKNLRAIALYEKFGFVREGLMRRDVFVDGAYENSLLMAVLFEDGSRDEG
jgi:ribosomal protein S18 acetylase RimI-like enzyme